ncbi:Phosphatidylinositol-4-phosphate 5-kinase [Didymella pomorum]
MSVNYVHESQMMPSYAAEREPSTSDAPNFSHPHPHTPKGLPHRTPSEKSLPLRERGPNGSQAGKTNALNMNGLPNGGARQARPSSIDRRISHDDARRGRADVDRESMRQSIDSRANSGELPARDDGYFASVHGSETKDTLGTTHVKLGQLNSFDGTREAQKDFVPHISSPPAADSSLRVPGSTHRVSAPPAFNNEGGSTTATPSPSQQPYRLQQRHTLEVPKLSTSRARDSQNNTDDVVTASGRFSPTTASRRRGSMSLVRRGTRSINSDMHLDEVPQDEDAARWAEHIRQKRASKRKRREDEDEDRVVVGTKVDQNHVNWVTAYNMLTGIRFTVSRTNAKMDRELTDADFDAKHKFSFDITGNELTPSAKYDFKFKDYAPWVFRHLRGIFKLDPADYLVSLTSKYILSELGSPGKSGSFFYFSRDYKYIIKTIHHAEHKFLRKILKDYYNHVQENPNTLLSQFYGLHRVKIPYGRKIHFVVMNNLFPPHRDIHRTFDLKGSTIGRDFREEDLEKNPRATLKDLNWLRRDLHLELGPTKKNAFIEQMRKDVKLMQKLHIMDYSMLIGIHDLEKGNEENLREKTLKVFQPGGEAAEEPQPNQLMRTPSKLETARKARELRQSVKTQKPVPMEQTSARMPDELEDSKKNFFFYSDDGGFQATHEDDRPGEEIYYLGIIDCLTHYSLIKRMEHFFKGLANTESQISAIPPERYGDRFIKFITGVTKTKEAADREKAEAGSSAAETVAGISRSSTDRVMEKAEHQAEKTQRHGVPEQHVPNLQMRVVRSPSAERGDIGTTLPVVEEAGEASSLGGRSNRSHEAPTRSPPAPPTEETHATPLQRPLARDVEHGRPPPTPPKDSATGSEERPPTPPKDGHYPHNRHSGPPTPPKEAKGRSSVDKELPRTPLETTIRVN